MHIFTRQGEWVPPWNASDIYIMSKKGIRSVNTTTDSGRWLEGLVLTAGFMIWWTGDLLQSSTAVCLWVPRCWSLVARSHHLLQMPTRILPKNFSTVGSFFTCRWQTYLSSWDYSSRFARNICCQPTLTARIRCCERKKFRREMFPKSRQARATRVWINIFYNSATRNFHKKVYCAVRFGEVFFCWMNLLYNNERASQHRNFTFIKKFADICSRYFVH